MVTLITKENIIAFVLALLSNGLLSYVLAVVTLVATVFFTMVILVTNIHMVIIVNFVNMVTFP